MFGEDLSFELSYKTSSPATVPDHPDVIMPNYLFMNICLKCFNELCNPVIDALKKEYFFELEDGDVELEDILCLISIKINIFTNLNHLDFVESNQFKVPYKIYLQDFYNHVSRYGRGLSYLHSKLKGGAAAILCMILKKALQTNLLSLDDYVVLLASGDLEDKEDMSGLVRYYQKLGFQQSEPENEYENIINMEVPMYGSVGDIVNNCKKIKISNELQQILDSI